MKQIWSKNDLGAYVCKLGTLERAIIIVKTAVIESLDTPPLKWRISISSYLPFTNSQHCETFDNPDDCALFAERIVLDWVKSLIEQEEVKGLNPPEFKKIATMERGQCGNCKHWAKYSDQTMKCSFYGSMPRTSKADKWCDMDCRTKFGFELKN